MKILITGGAGFIGSSVVRLAIARGHSIINVDALTYAACLESLAGVSEDSSYRFVHADIRDRGALDQIFSSARPDVVMHLAAESHVDRSIDGPCAFIETNVLGTFNMLEASRKYWVDNGRFSSFRFHHISTDEVYGTLRRGGGDKFTESTPYNPRSPYSASKASSDHLVRAWGETYGLPVIITNCSNNYGPYHFPEKLIPLVIINALHGQSLPIYGDGSNVRDWLFVEDHANALLLVVEQGAVGGTYNIGGNNELSNLEVVLKICNILDRLRPLEEGKNYSELISFVADRPGHDERYAIDSSLIQHELGWRPSISPDEGLELTVQWYLDNEKWWRPLLAKPGVGRRLGIGG